jgi:hypothetical protein
METTSGREPLQILEIYQPSCANTYGTTPCTAAIGVTGSRKCFNGTVTCQDRAALDLSHMIVWRFCKPAANIPRTLYESSTGLIKTGLIPSLVSVTTSPTRLNVGGGSENESPFGRRANLSAVLQDHPYDDSAADKYLADRDYTPLERGTFWGKWLARNPYYEGWQVIVYDGYVGQTLAEMSQRLYLLKDIEGPNSNGGVKIIAEDPLRLGDDKRALVPAVSEALLRDAINASQTTGIVIVSDEDEVAQELGNTSTTRYIRFDDEIISYTGYSGTGGEWELTGAVRGTLGTTADEHDADEKAQRVVRYEALESWLIAHDIVANYMPGAAAYTSLSAWDAEASVWLAGFIFTGTIAEPTPANEVLGELCESSLFYIFWNERSQSIDLHAIRAPTTVPPTITDAGSIVADSFSVKTETEQRLSRVVVYYGQRDPTEALDDGANYANSRLRIDVRAESPEEGDIKRIRRVFSRWITTAPQAIQVAVRLLSRFRNAPRYVRLTLDAKDRALWTAEHVLVEHFSLLDDTGAVDLKRWQIISAEEIMPGEKVVYDLQNAEFYGRLGFWTEDAAVDYASASEAERETNGYWTDDAGLIDGDPGPTWQ